MNKKLKIGIFAGTPLLFIAIAITTFLIWLNVFLPKYTADKVNEYLGDNAEVEKITSSFPDGLVMHNLKVAEPDEFGVFGTAEKVSVRFDVFKFLIGQIDESAVKEIEFDEFEIVIKAKPKPIKPEIISPAESPVPDSDKKGFLDKLLEVGKEFGKNDIRGNSPLPVLTKNTDTRPNVTDEVRTTKTGAGEYEVVPSGDTELDCSLLGHNGIITLLQGKESKNIAKNMELDGSIGDGIFDVAVDALPAVGENISAECVIATDMSNGRATYIADEITVSGFMKTFGRPNWIKDADGEINMTGSFVWTDEGKFLHESDLELTNGVVRFNAAKLKVDFENIQGRFYLNNDEIGVNKAGFVFANTEWSIDGFVRKGFINFTFSVKNFGLQNLVTMISDSFPLILPGKGDVMITIKGPTYLPDVKVKISKVGL